MKYIGDNIIVGSWVSFLKNDKIVIGEVTSINEVYGFVCTNIGLVNGVVDIDQILEVR